MKILFRLLLVCLLLPVTNTSFAQKKIDSLLTVIHQSKPDTSQLKLYERICMISFSNRDFDNGLKYANEALNIATKLNLKNWQAFFYQGVGLMFAAQKRTSPAMEYFANSVKLYRELNNKKMLLTVFKKIAKTYENSGNSVKQTEALIESIEIGEDWLNDKLNLAELNNARSMLADAYNDLAWAYSGQASLILENSPTPSVIVRKKFQDAERMLNRAIDLHKGLIEDAKAGGNVAKAENNYANTLEVAGMVYYVERKYEESLQNMREAMKIAKKYNRTSFVAALSNNIGANYKEWGHLALNRGNVDSSSVLFGKALEYWKVALDWEQETKDKSRMAATLNNIGFVYQLQQKYDSAIVVLEDALANGKESDHKEWMKYSLDHLAQCYAAINDHERAYLAHLRYSELKDSLLNEASSRQIEEMSTKYETAQKDKEIGLLTKEKSIQSLLLKEQQILALQKEKDLQFTKQEKELQAFELEKRNYEFNEQRLLVSKKESEVALLNKDKAIQTSILQNTQKNRNMIIASLLGMFLFAGTVYYYRNQRNNIAFKYKLTETELNLFRSQMNPHFMFNALNSIHSYVITNDKKNATNYLEKFSKLMYMILDNSNNKLVTLADDLEALDLYLELEAERLNQRFSYEIIVAKDIDTGKVLVPPMILQPFLENSVWHGMMHKETGGKIQLEVTRNGDLIECVIRDNGKGLGKVDGRTVVKAKKSFGINITKQRLENLNRLNRTSAYCDIQEIRGAGNEPEGVCVKVGLPIGL